ncbi:MAG: hypothetical protein ACRCW3_00490, partial [Metamycoplasmataceae bacterium]
WVKEKLLEIAAGVAVFSGQIQVSVKPKICREDWVAKAGIKSALLTADWQFHRPIENEGGGLGEGEIVCKKAVLRCLLRLLVERGREMTGMYWKHMVGGKESSWRLDCS